MIKKNLRKGNVVVIKVFEKIKMAVVHLLPHNTIWLKLILIVLMTKFLLEMRIQAWQMAQLDGFQVSYFIFGTNC